MASYTPDEKKYLKNGLSTIKNLIKEKDYSTAEKACDELLMVFPAHSKAFSLQRKSQKLWKKNRLKKVRETLKKSRPLWKEKKYEELLKIYQTLDQFLPDCPKVLKGLHKLNTLMKKQQEKKQESYIKQGLLILDDLEKKQNYKQAIDVLNELIDVDSMDNRIQRSLTRIKRKYVDQKINEAHQQFLKNEQYEDILFTYSKLLKVTPDYKKLHKLILKTEKLIFNQRVNEKDSYIRKSLQKIYDLYEKKKFQDCIQACLELQSLDPQNFPAKLWRFRAKHADRRLEETELFDQMEKAWDTIGADINAAISKFGPVKGLKGYSKI